LRGRETTPDTLRWLKSQGVRYHTMAEVVSRGWPKVAEAVRREAARGPEALFISFDVSALDPGQGSAIGRATPGGLELREVIPLIRRLCAERQVVGFEIMDLAPMLDGTYVSAMNANYVMNACLAGLALRKRGVAADWVNPLAISP
jgi:arginase family enzyme